MDGKCICETGDTMSMGDGLGATEIAVTREDGVWGVEVAHEDNYGPCRYEPISYCPICGREL